MVYPEPSKGFHIHPGTAFIIFSVL